MFKKIVKAIAFVVIFVILFNIIEFPLTKFDVHAYQTWGAFYSEEKKTLDAVYIGPSTTYAFFQAPLAYNDYGITVLPISIPNMPAASIKYVIEEARKTQPDALYIINANNFRSVDNISTWIHYLSDDMKFSKTKIDMINDLCESEGIPFSDRLEYYIPLIRFHSSWSSLASASFNFQLEGMKGASHYSLFRNKSVDVSAQYNETEELGNLSDKQSRILLDLLDYAKDSKVKIMFLMVPQSGMDETTLAQFNMVQKTIEDNGFECLNMARSAEEMGVTYKTDYYNPGHMNIHGSIKYTDYLSKYLIQKYGFTDKRKTEGYESWNEAAEKYINIIDNNVLDIELTHQQRDLTMQAPNIMYIEGVGDGINIKWQSVENADGYSVYRKKTSEKSTTYDSKWEKLADVDSSTLNYLDITPKKNVNYTYTVIAFYNKDGKRVYGEYLIKGIGCSTAKIETPLLKSLTEDSEGIKITWNAVEGIEKYDIYRKIVGEEYNKIATVGNTDEFVDKHYLKGVPYIYTVRAVKEEKGKIRQSAYDRNGLLRLVDLPAPEVKAYKDADGAVNLLWNRIQGANCYYVYKQTEYEKWELAADDIALGKESFTDRAVTDSKKASYRVSAVIINGDDIYEYPSDTVELK